MKIIFHILVLLSLGSCQFFRSTPPLRQESNILEKSYADLRKDNIRDVQYSLQFDLTKKDNFSGTAEIRFKLKDYFYFSLDFTGGQVHQLFVNNKKVKKIKYNGFFIEIPEKDLVVGENVIKIDYSHEYSKNGTGLHRSIDPEDNKTYIYSNSEPYQANQFFPCFDQPNLKASYRTEVLAPQSWQVISANREQDKIERNNGILWQFPKTARFSTYTYSLHAGEYQVWESVAKTKNQEIPLRLFARQTLAKSIDPKEWFDLTQSGFLFFEDYFSTQYPYGKYDQLIVPEYNHGAMENVGAVTFNEDRFVERREKTREEKRALASTLYHEMAHMWFGNLVTMNWWDDLWLNESFATYSAAVGLVESTEFKEAWEIFNIRSKQKAYILDQSINTHPVAMPVESTDKAFTHFDSITYGKGAALLKQMAYLIGDKDYKKSLKLYFEKYAHSNTTLSDFFSTIEEVAKVDLKIWQERWLKTSMVNDIEVNFTCHKGRIDYFDIYQTASQAEPMLRSHKTKVAILQKWQGNYRIHRTKEVEYSGERTFVKAFIGEVCPDIVYPNYNDFDYATIMFDKKSLKNIENDILTIQDSFLRGMMWSDLWLMVLNKKIHMGRYLEIVEFNGLSEENQDNRAVILSHVESVLNTYFPDDDEDWQKKRQVWVKFFEQAYLSKIQESAKEVENQKKWFESLVKISESPEVLNEIARLLENKKSIFSLSFIIDQDLRWELLARLTRFSQDSAKKLVAIEKKRDKSQRGLVQLTYIASLKPDVKSKRNILDSIVSGHKTTKFNNLKAQMNGLFPSNQKELHKLFADEYFEKLKKLYKKADQIFIVEFSNILTPYFCDSESSGRVNNFLKAEKELPVGLIKSLKSALFENQRCSDMQKLYKNEELLQSTGIR